MAVKSKSKKKNVKTLVPSACKGSTSEAKRILKANMSRIPMEQTDVPYITSFFAALLKEQGEDIGEAIPDAGSPADFTPERNAQDFKQNLNPETSPENFDTEGVDPGITTQNLEQIKVWAKKLDEFANFLNDPDKSTSLHRILADSDKAGSVLRGVTRKASDSITRIAGEVEKLKEVLNTFLITAPKKQRDAAQTTGPVGA